MKLNNHVALITGAGTGIGRAIAERFAREGARVAVNYRRSQKQAEEVVAGIRSKGGTVIPLCPFVTHFVERNDGYADLVAPSYAR